MKQFKKWLIEPSGMVNNSIKQTMTVNCGECSNDFNIILEYEMSTEVSAERFVCPHCKHTYEFTDENFADDFVVYHKNNVVLQSAEKANNASVAFFIRDASAVGGGTKVLFKHIEWLLNLGCDVTVYSYSQKPDWVNLNLHFVRLESLSQIDGNAFNKIVVFSIFDVPAILNTVPISKVVHLCQGYEGYHFGRTYEELRSDKHILTMLHAIPVENISVSTHLVDLFNEKFNRKSEYIPNSINHKIFKFSNYTPSNSKSILFIGNPLHPLKGFEFLASSIKAIQYSKSKIEDLKLNIVMGFKHENIDQIRDDLVEELKCNIEIKEKLTSEKIADLVKKSSVVVCTSWYEGFSLPILEAMASGVPVITTNNMGAESFCVHEKNSFIVRYGDHQNLIKYLVNIFYQAASLKAVLRNAYRTSLVYTELNSVKSLVDTYQSLLGVKFDKEKSDSLLSRIESTSNAADPEKSPCTGKDVQENISIVIPVYNNVEYTQKCAESLFEFTPQLSKLIIVDNASTDETATYLKELADRDSRVKIISNSENLGFPKAVNQGLKECESEFTVIANNDIIFTSGWASRLIELADSNIKVGIVGPVSNIVSGVQLDKSAVYSSIPDMHKYAAKLSETKKGKFFEFPRVAFLCTLIKKELLDKIGGLDERFTPGNFEDDDFCLRAELAGYKTLIAEDVFIHHFGSKSFKAKGAEDYNNRLEQNQKIFIQKWGADPEDIWLHGKKFTNRKPFLPIDKNIFIQSIKRAMILLEDKDYEIAVLELTNALLEYNNYPKEGFEHLKYTDILNLAGNTALLFGNIEMANDFFKQELEIEPSSARACTCLAEVFFAAGMLEESKTMFEWALKNDSNYKAAIDGLAKIENYSTVEEGNNNVN